MTIWHIDCAKIASTLRIELHTITKGAARNSYFCCGQLIGNEPCDILQKITAQTVHFRLLD